MVDTGGAVIRQIKRQRLEREQASEQWILDRFLAFYFLKFQILGI